MERPDGVLPARRAVSDYAKREGLEKSSPVHNVGGDICVLEAVLFGHLSTAVREATDDEDGSIAELLSERSEDGVRLDNLVECNLTSEGTLSATQWNSMLKSTHLDSQLLRQLLASDELLVASSVRHADEGKLLAALVVSSENL